jgi:hypothetical protein
MVISYRRIKEDIIISIGQLARLLHHSSFLRDNDLIRIRRGQDVLLTVSMNPHGHTLLRMRPISNPGAMLLTIEVYPCLVIGTTPTTIAISMSATTRTRVSRDSLDALRESHEEGAQDRN